MLELMGVHASYGTGAVLRGVSLRVSRGEVVGLLGRNGAGKTTTLKSVLGLVRVHSGSVRFEDRELSRWPAHEIARLGIGYIPQSRRVFPQLSVHENLLVGWRRAPIDRSQLEKVLQSFPQLWDRLDQRAGTLSGGEQQMLAIARALLMESKLVLLDEPTEGLMPSLVGEVERLVREMATRGLGVLLAEQRLDTALRLCQRIYVLEKGVVVWEGAADPEGEEHVKRHLRVG
jgi:branched-chain amino acid transport system ATP-binding protein